MFAERHQLPRRCSNASQEARGRVDGGADFQAVPTTGAAPLTVQFNSSCVGVVESYPWSFGDGNMTSDVNPTHTYTAAGTCRVSLTITGPMGSDIKTRSNWIKDAPPPDLSITQTDAPDPAAFGGALTYSLQVANAGPTPATGVVLTDTLPTTVAFVSATAAQGSCARVLRTMIFICLRSNIFP